MTTDHSAELTAFAERVVADLEAAGPFADWLQEHGMEKEGGLLRRRWKRWKTERVTQLNRVPAMLIATAQKMFDETFANYIRSRFCGVRIEQVRHWYEEAGRCHAVVRVESGVVYTACKMLAFGRKETSDRQPTRICRKCREALPMMRLKPKGSGA